MNEPPNSEESIFDAASQMPPERRAAYLDQACGPDAELRRRLDLILAAHDRDPGFMAESVAAAPASALRAVVLKTEKPGDLIGRYKLLQQIGEGGCGVVYMAEQETPVRRRVALKVIKLGMDTRNVIARFEAERQALALMDHPNIAKVFDAGATDAGRPFFVMELVRGVKITEFCDENKVSTEDRLRLFIQVCQAIQHAHQKGVIHRDIKPSNILVTLRDCEPVPKVIDFGIAKATTDQRLTDKTMFTAFEQFIGTPAYMSPEQAEMSELGIDTRSDIYSLGVLLYELLTGSTPFDARLIRQASIAEARRIIREVEPVRPSTRLGTLTAADLAAVAKKRRAQPGLLSYSVRGELDWIVMKALEKDRGRRYATSNGFAADVERFLADEPVLARPSSGFYRFQKLVRRHRVAFGAATAVLTALCLGLGAATWQFFEKSKAEREQRRLRAAAETAQAEEAQLRLEAQAQGLAARRKAYAGSMNLLQQALREDNLGRAVELLDGQRPTAGSEDLRGWEWRYLWQFCRSDAQATVCHRSNVITSISFSGDGALLALATGTGEVTVWDVATDRMILRSGDSCQCFAHVAFAPSGDLLAYEEQTNVVVWNSSSRTEVQRLPMPAKLHDLQFLADGRLLTVESSRPNRITLWDAAAGSRLTNFTAQLFPFGIGTRLVVSPDGRTIACAVSAQSVRVQELGAETGAWTFAATEEQITAMAFSRDGAILATAAGFTDNAIKLWDIRNRRLIGQLEGHRSWVAQLIFLADGKLASSSADQTIRLWDVGRFEAIRTFRGHRSEVRVLDVSPDGRTLASGGKDGTVLLWDLASLAARPPGWLTVESIFKPGPMRTLQFSPDSRMIAVVESDAVKLYEATTLRPILPSPDLGLTLSLSSSRLLFSPDSKLLLAAGVDGHLAAWDLVAQRRLTNFVAHPGAANLFGSSFTRDGRGVLTVGSDNEVREWDVASWRETAHWPLNPQPVSVEFVFSSSSTNGWLAAKSGFDQTIQVLRLSDPAKRNRLFCPPSTTGIAFSPDGQTVASVSMEGFVALTDTRTLANAGRLGGVLLGLHSVAFSPDGRRVAAGGNGKEAVKIWDFVSHEELVTLEGKGSIFYNVAFSPDGNLVAARNLNGMLHLWRAPSWETIELQEQKR